MKIYSTYACKIKHYNHIFKDTVIIYRKAVDFLIGVCLVHWDEISLITSSNDQMSYVEHLVHKTKQYPNSPYDFDDKFYKFPCYLLRSAIMEALGKVSSYKSNLSNWEAMDKKTRGKKPALPKAGFVYPCLYRDNMYQQIDTYKFQIKVYTRNTWDWITVQLKESDVDYINKHCSVINHGEGALKSRKICAPTLQKRGKEWFLDFPIEERVSLNNTKVKNQNIIAVDLGINNACTLSIMNSEGTILGREFLSLPREIDSLGHAINRIKKAQQHGNHKTPRLWAKANGINDHIAVETATFIINNAVLYNADVIVFEHLDLHGKKRGSKKQRLQLWRAKYVQAIVNNKAHRLGIRVNHVNAWGTSRLAYDGSGKVLRGKETGLTSYSVCKFTTGKTYNCDLNASYNIGARCFIREILKSVSATMRLGIEAKVPQCTKRSTCTLSTLINLNAVLAANAA